MKKIIFGILISLIYFFILLITLSHYGLNEDSPGHFLRGQAYLNKLTTGKDTFDQAQLPSPLLFVAGQRISSYKPSAYENGIAPLRPIAGSGSSLSIQKLHKDYETQYGRKSFYKHNAWAMGYQLSNDGGHPPVSDIIMAASNRIFYEWFGIVDDISSYYLYVILLSSLTLFFIYYFVSSFGGKLAGFLAASLLALYPLYFAESHFNIKDIPELSYFTIALISFYFWKSRQKIIWGTIFFISFFLGLGTKFNILFIPFILLPWAFFVRKNPEFPGIFSKKTFLTLFLFLIFAFLFLIFLWPYLWDNPMQKLLSIFSFYKETGTVDLRIQSVSPFRLPFGIDLRGLIYLLTMTPIATLVFFFVGLFLSLVAVIKKHDGRDIFLLLILWLSIPLARVSFGGADVFESMRQFAEILPPFIIIAAIGASFIIEHLALRFSSREKVIKSLSILIYLIYLIWLNVQYHPNQNVYFNAFAGGPKGAVKHTLLGWQTAYENPYRQAVNWFNQSAKKDAKLAFLDGTMFGISPIWLRDDIHIGSYFSGLFQKGEYVVSIVYPKPPQVFPYLYLERFLNPVHEVSVMGVPLAKVWINDKEHVKPEYRRVRRYDKKFDRIFGKNTLGKYWEIILPQEVRIVKVTVKTPETVCSPKDGLFYLNGYFVPQREDNPDRNSVFYFPAIKTKRIRFYGITKNSCLFQGTVDGIHIL